MPTEGLIVQADSQDRGPKGRRGALQPSPFCLGRFLQIRYRGREDNKLLSSGFRNVYKGLLFSCLLGHNKNAIMIQQANLSGSEPGNGCPGSTDTKMRGNKGSPLPPELPSPVPPPHLREGAATFHSIPRGWAAMFSRQLLKWLPECLAPKHACLFLLKKSISCLANKNCGNK